MRVSLVSLYSDAKKGWVVIYEKEFRVAYVEAEGQTHYKA